MQSELRRTLGAGGAVLLGLGSILGSGIFVSAGLSAEAAGPSMLLAILAAGCLAICNGLSSAQLASAVPRSGGTYEYGRRYLRPEVGHSAGWLFLSAKSASAATAALGFAAYLGRVVGQDLPAAPVALVTIVLLALLVAGGLRRSNRVNLVLVGLTVAGLVAFAVAALPQLRVESLRPFFAPVAPDRSSTLGFLEAVALMFVAYTGYGRVATLGEEIRNPARNIPRAVVLTLAVSLALYFAVSLGALALVGPAGFAEGSVRNQGGLVAAIEGHVPRWLSLAIGVAACTSLLGVLLNLLLGLSRVVFAMGRGGDLPRILGRATPEGDIGALTVLATALVPLGLAAVGSIKLAWSFSAFTVLFYYGITNACALRQPPAERRYPRWTAWAGLAGCIGLAFFVDWRMQLAGVVWVGLGMLVRFAYRRLAADPL